MGPMAGYRKREPNAGNLQAFSVFMAIPHAGIGSRQSASNSCHSAFPTPPLAYSRPMWHIVPQNRIYIQVSGITMEHFDIVLALARIALDGDGARAGHQLQRLRDALATTDKDQAAK